MRLSPPRPGVPESGSVARVWSRVPTPTSWSSARTRSARSRLCATPPVSSCEAALSADPGPADAPLTAVGERVVVRPATPADEPAYVEAVTRSARRLADFAVPDPHNLPVVLANQSPTYRTFMVVARDPQGEHGLVGRINV